MVSLRSARESARKFLRLGLPERTLVLKASLLVVAIRFSLLLIPFRHLLNILALLERGSTKKNAAASAQIAWAVGAATRRLGGKEPCLIQALAAKTLLTRHGYPASLRIGVARINDRIRAHAWIEGDEGLIFGASREESFTPFAGLEKLTP